MSFDREKVIKLLEMTFSNHEGEALNAIKLANSILKKEELNWTNFFSKHSNSASVKPIKKKQKSDINTQEPKQIHAMFEFCNGLALSPKTYDFLDSLESFFDDKGFLSEKQYEALCKIYNEGVNNYAKK